MEPVLPVRVTLLLWMTLELVNVLPYEEWSSQAACVLVTVVPILSGTLQQALVSVLRMHW